ncbi:hypothetical protein ES319_A05G307200v1 [Gossypium barbadense]|uniref:Uncharacterized protein n=2 Tax=Gossypium TaxID=3633 RepID=A0A5J5VWB2_GOSBA|nr:hypothetical protein ES319_A05G307200v1 [Gossypium barbadense]TYH19051.1 hypothetical protein ES288_A05G321700v1 [Gossypium darwinii]
MFVSVVFPLSQVNHTREKDGSTIHLYYAYMVLSLYILGDHVPFVHSQNKNFRFTLRMSRDGDTQAATRADIGARPKHQLHNTYACRMIR